jgi:hypothetical protein
MHDKDLFINYINDHYDKLKNKYWKFCQEKDYDWSEDVFQDTILKCYQTIEKVGKLKDTSSYGIESYFFKSFKNNTLLEKVYCRTKNRDYNINSDNINDIYENWYNNHNSTAREKLINDLYKDFATLYIMLQVENNFDSEHFYLFRVKVLTPEMTFKKLAQETKVKASREKVIDVMHWVKENISKEQINKAFNEIYGNLI